MAIFHSNGAAAAAGRPTQGRRRRSEGDTYRRSTLSSGGGDGRAAAPRLAGPGSARWGGRRAFPEALVAVSAGDARARPRNAPQSRPRRLAPLPSPPPGCWLASPPHTPPARSGGSISTLHPLHPAPQTQLVARPLQALQLARTHALSKHRFYFGIPVLGNPERSGFRPPRTRHWDLWGLKLGIPLPIFLFPSRPRSSLLARTAPRRSGCVFYPPRLQVFSAPRAPSGRPRNF